MRHLAGGKDHKQAAGRKPAHALAQRPAVPRVRLGRVERVHQNRLRVNFGHARQKRVGDNFVILADAIEKRHQDQTFHNAVGMIGHHHGRAGDGQPFQIAVVQGEPDVEKFQEPPGEVRAEAALARFVEPLGNARWNQQPVERRFERPAPLTERRGEYGRERQRNRRHGNLHTCRVTRLGYAGMKVA